MIYVSETSFAGGLESRLGCWWAGIKTRLLVGWNQDLAVGGLESRLACWWAGMETRLLVGWNGD